MEVFEVLELNSVKLSRASSGSYLCMFWVLKVSCLWFGLNLYWPIGASAGSVKKNRLQISFQSETRGWTWPESKFGCKFVYSTVGKFQIENESLSHLW